MMDMMVRKLLQIGSLSAGVAIALATLVGLPQTGVAQITANPDEGFSNPEESHDAFSENAEVGDMLDLIHRANFENSRSSEEIWQDRRNNIQDAAELFRQQQQERLLQQRQNQPQPNALPPTSPDTTASP